MEQETIVRNEFPNPVFERKNWKSLNGSWDFAFDDGNEYEKAAAGEWEFPMKIKVPFCYQSAMSGIGTDRTCNNIWYSRTFELSQKELAGSVLLKFGAVDYTAKIWVNGKYIGRHDGGYTPFEFDITGNVLPGANKIVVKAEDSYTKEYPRGKQMWAKDPDMCWYTNHTGIWQSVWLEFTGSNYITRAHITPDIDRNQAHFEINTHKQNNISIRAVLRKNGEFIGEATVIPMDGKSILNYTFEESSVRAVFDLYWSPEFPVLIDVELIMTDDGVEQDRVYTYFGMRKIHVEGDKIFINNQLLYQRLVLDQGYWPESLITPPSDEAILKDIELTKAMGFNGARKHQKIEDPRYYYWADKKGLLVWGELPSAYDFTFDSRRRLMRDMQGFIERDFNHPCIVNWVPINESWGVHQVADNPQQQDFVRAMYYLIRANDPTRTVSSNDGWEQIETGDICGVHDYDITPENVKTRYHNVYEILKSSVNFKPVYSRGISYTGIPIMMTEMGGIKLKGGSGWGYRDEAENSEKMLERLNIIVSEIRNNKDIRGYCYTQLTDVMQETNGLLTPDREPKIPVERLRDIFGK